MRWSCGADGRVPRRAQRQVILFFWPMRSGTVRNSVCVGRFTDQAWALVTRSPNKTANLALAMVHHGRP